MKRILLIACLSLSIGSFAQSYTLNTKGGTVSFNYVSESTKGSLKDVEAKVNINSGKLSASTVSGSVSVATLSTGNKTRDQHLMSDEFFDAKKFPKMTFETGEVTKDGENLHAKGKLTIKGVSKDVTFSVYEKEGALHFKATIYGSDFGVSTKKDRESSKIQVIVKIPLS
jgi:polyisoprenoid-binding protein YceI